MSELHWKYAIVRIRDSEGEVVGAGFLTESNFIVTCAHVISQALSHRDDFDVRGKRLQIEFPFLRPLTLIEGEVLLWKPIIDKRTYDLAIMRILEPNRIDVSGLTLDPISENLWGTEFQAYGFPTGHDDGIWASGELKEVRADGLLQIEDFKTEGRAIEEGFSGTPVWAPKYQRVVAMVVSRDLKSGSKVAFAMPVQILLNAINEIRVPSNNVGARTTDIKCEPIDRLFQLITKRPDPIFFLGAGASQKSGIPLTSDLVARGVRFAYCDAHDLLLDDPTVRRSDWLDWLREHTCYNPSVDLDDQYVEIFQNLLTPLQRKLFFDRINQPEGIPSGLGYSNLLKLLAHQRIFTILTANFDTVLSATASRTANPHRVIVIETPDQYHHVSTAPQYPQIIYIHGNVSYYAENYFDDGYERLHHGLSDHLLPLLRDHPLIVVGYGGREISIMQDLFLKNLERARGFQNGIYWCLWESESGVIHPNVSKLSGAVGANFHFVQIIDFEHLIERLLYISQNTTNRPIVPSEKHATAHRTFDMETVRNVSLETLDWAQIEFRIIEYCEKTGIKVPAAIGRQWLIDQMQARDLAYEVDGNIYPSVAGFLLFGRDLIASGNFSSAFVRVQVLNKASTYKGNLWQQLQVISDLENEFNTPFRLKGISSETVYPYPPLALKELIVNALVHRRYDTTEPVTIDVQSDHITITNPGGLLAPIHSQLPQGISAEDALGQHKIKAYRNPVIADFFYSSGEMDKLGSGLMDVRRWVRQNEGNLHFRLSPDDSFFQVTIFARTDQIDTQTGSATIAVNETRYISNVLEFIEIPDLIWYASTEYRHVPNLKEAARESVLPAIILSRGYLYTFSDLSVTANPLREFIDTSTIRSTDRDEFAHDQSTSRQFVNLLNDAIQNHVKEHGLLFDWRRKRTHFPKEKDDTVKIQYQSRFRRTSRTVVRAKRNSNGQIRFWEHNALRFHVREFGNAWTIQVVPTYVYTFDGFEKYLPGEQSTSMATRRMSREYNQAVDQHIVFWTSYLSTSETEICLEDEFRSYLSIRNTPVDFVLRGSSFQGEESQSEIFGEDELDEFDELFLEEDFDDDLVDEEGND